MLSFITLSDAQNVISKQLRNLRLSKGLTQAGLADRSGVSLPTLKRFEKTGLISLESFLKLCLTLECLDKIIEATQMPEQKFSSIDDVLKNSKKKKLPQRGWKK